MGMFDNVSGKVVCPNCEKLVNVSDQFKFGPCILETYELGDFIPISDDEYTKGSWIRNILVDKCSSCGNWIRFKFTVKNSKITEFDSIESYTPETSPYEINK